VRTSDLSSRVRPTRRFVAVGFALVAIAAAPSCIAQVIEIAPDGTTSTYAIPAVFTIDGAHPIDVGSGALPTVGSFEVTRVIAEAAARQQISANLISAVAWQESRFRQNAVSPRDAVGLMQLTAATARDLGVDRYDGRQNVQGGAAYLRGLMDRYRGDLRLTLAAYNAGPGAVAHYRGVPPFAETQSYVSAILSRLARRTPVGSASLLFKP
jgi:soluble lytic murein transglycosylase-like protein